MSLLHNGLAFFTIPAAGFGSIALHKAAGLPTAETSVPPGFFAMKLARNVRGWFAARRTMKELNSLSNQTLNDIGLTRHDIRQIASRAYE